MRSLLPFLVDDSDRTISKHEKCILVEADSRILLGKLPENSIDCVITSPPYGNLKNYGPKEQLGYGQKMQSEYLPDMELILRELFRVSTPGAALWLVLDSWKSAGELFPLPWEIMAIGRNVGWKFQDMIVWDKGKSLPWSHKGRFRNTCESILLLSKGNLTHFDLDAVRETDNLSPYWVRYPERYHPDGKAPSDLWHFPIPTQGSWANGSMRHFCPFPVGLVSRMITITSKPGDIVLDPFSGTGSVPAVASYLKRNGIGIEINRKFVRKFQNTGYSEFCRLARLEIGPRNQTFGPLRKTISELRVLKYARSLFVEISRKDKLDRIAQEVIGAFIFKTISFSKKQVAKDPTKIGKISLQILLREGKSESEIRETVIEQINRPPLSKFGLIADVSIVAYETWINDEFFSDFPMGYWHVYRRGNFYQYCERIQRRELAQTLFQDVSDSSAAIPSIFSKLKQNIIPPPAH